MTAVIAYAWGARPRAAREGIREIAVKLTDALLGEHGVFSALFDRIEAVTAAATSVV
jgi:hypothetical protein